MFLMTVSVGESDLETLHNGRTQIRLFFEVRL